MVGDRSPHRRTDRLNIFKHGPSRALSYIIGANIGDGCTLLKNWCVKLVVADLDFARAYNINMKTLFSRTAPNKILTRNENGRLPMYEVKYSSKQLAKLLLSPLETLLDIAFVYPLDFLRGFFDAEGHVDVRAGGKRFNVSAGVENSNVTLLRRIKQVLLTACEIRSIKNKKRKAGSLKVIRGKAFLMRKTSFTLLINRYEDLQRFAHKIGFSIARKNEKLEDAFSIIAQYPVRVRAEEWRRRYFKQGGEWVKRPPESSNESKVLMKD